MNSKSWSLHTRFLHLGLVGTVTAQLFISLVMAEPGEKGGFLASLAYDAHQVIGLSALGIVLIHWLWSSVSHADGGLGHLFPWWGDARKEVITDAKLLLKGQFPAPTKKGGLAGLIHGLGLLAVTGIALSGAMIFVLFPETGKPGPIGHTFAELHEGAAGLVWAYWLGHGGIALLHHARGHDVLKRMFSLNNDKTPRSVKVAGSTQKSGLNQHREHPVTR